MLGCALQYLEKKAKEQKSAHKLEETVPLLFRALTILLFRRIDS